MKLSLNLLILLIFLILSSCSKHKPAPIKEIKYNSSQPLSKRHKFKPKYTIVKKGDTLYSIGFSHNIDYKTLAKINNIKKPYRIYPGQKLSLINNNKSKKRTKKTATVVTKPLTKSPKFISKNSSGKSKTNPVSKPTGKPTTQKKNSKPVTKPISKPVNKPVSKPIKKPIKKPSQQAPSSNSKWIWPVKGRIISSFSNTDATRKGIDIKASIGDSVYASNNGIVVYSGNGLLGYGELIIIKHSDSLLSAYANNSKRLVNEGDSVKQGVVIAKSGKASDGTPLLHFEIRKNGKPVNPVNFLPKH